MQVTVTKKDLTRIVELKKIFERMKMELEGAQEILAFSQVVIWAHELEARISGVFSQAEADEKEKLKKALELFEAQNTQAKTPEINSDASNEGSLTQMTPLKSVKGVKNASRRK
jgi:hypothetical protein